MIPSQVQHKAGGPWYPWTNGNVSPDQLTVAKQIGQASYINGCLTFALKTSEGHEWNCREGWK